MNGLEEEEEDDEEEEDEVEACVAVAMLRPGQMEEEVVERSRSGDEAWKAGDVDECGQRYVNAGIVVFELRLSLSWFKLSLSELCANCACMSELCVCE